MTKHATPNIPTYPSRLNRAGEMAFAAIGTGVLIDDQLFNIT
jgi:hypothetical protein